MAVVVIDVVLGFVQEYQRSAPTPAQKPAKPTTTVIRDGQRQEVEVKNSCRATCLLTMGEHVPGDGELVESTKLAVTKHPDRRSEPVNRSAADNQSAVRGCARLEPGQVFMARRSSPARTMRVTQTGSRTELGKIARAARAREEIRRCRRGSRLSARR